VSASRPFLDLLAELAAPAAAEWLAQRHADLSASSFAAAYAGAGRRFGDAPAQPSPAQQSRLRAASAPIPQGWPLKHIARSALLQRAAELAPANEHLALVTGVYRGGDNAEREALLKTLPLLPDAGRFVELGVEACRSHVQSVFEAIACDNPYPARFFPDLNFNQLVLKAFFTGVAVQRIVGLADRRNAELVRMAQAYASERRAAGRAVPPDLDSVTLGPATEGPRVTPEVDR
jgi:hypothetical protein